MAFLEVRLSQCQGGVPVRDKKGQVIGAVGVTGDSSDHYLIVALAGIELAGLTGEG